MKKNHFPDAKASEKGTRKQAPVVLVLTKAKELFEIVSDKNAESKRRCIEMAVNARGPQRNYGLGDFKRDFLSRVNLLQNSVSFKKLCNSRNFDAFAAATHVVFYYTLTQVINLAMGIDNTAWTPYVEWAEPIFTKAELEGRENRNAHQLCLPEKI